MKKILFLLLSLGLASSAFGMDWFNPISYSIFGGGKPTSEVKVEEPQGLNFPFDEDSKKAFAGFVTLMVTTGKNKPKLKRITQPYEQMQEIGFDGLVKQPKFDNRFNSIFAKWKQEPAFKEAEKNLSTENWKNAGWALADLLHKLAGINFPKKESKEQAKEFLELNAKLPETSFEALKAGAVLQLVVVQMQREEKQKQVE